MVRPCPCVVVGDCMCVHRLTGRQDVATGGGRVSLSVRGGQPQPTKQTTNEYIARRKKKEARNSHQTFEPLGFACDSLGSVSFLSWVGSSRSHRLCPFCTSIDLFLSSGGTGTGTGPGRFLCSPGSGSGSATSYPHHTFTCTWGAINTKKRPTRAQSPCTPYF